MNRISATTPTKRSRAVAEPVDPPVGCPPASRAKMVCWYNPLQLARTGVEVAVSTVFGRNSDYRLIEAVSAGDRAEFYDHSTLDGQPVDELWIDYVSDVGDGFNSTYAVARTIAQDTLTAPDRDGATPTTLRGGILIFGGDEVYPTANRDRYRRKLVSPYEAALPQPDGRPLYVYAVPGNHDWYDSLVSFSRLFCGGRTFAAWRAQQARSYFALKLPHGWWLLGTDVQLDSDIDAPQVAYFNEVCAEMRDGDNVILCTAEPHWVETAMYGEMDPSVTDNNLRFLEQRVLAKVNVRVFVAGDLHHYRRHANHDGSTQKITAGGGGAFLHPTHGPDVHELVSGGQTFTQREAFPNEQTSKWLTWWNLAFIVRNPLFGLLTGVLYTVIACSCRADRMGRFGLSEFGSAAAEGLRGFLDAPVWASLVFVGVLFFTDTHSRLYKWVAGTIHASCHLLAAFGLGWAAGRIGLRCAGGPESIPARLTMLVCVFAGGWVVGSVLMGLYLLVSLNGFGRHSNEAFSSLAIADWKNFLRFHIGRDGDLTIYPYGIRRVPRRWKTTANGSIEPDGVAGRDWTLPVLIEPAVTVRRTAGARGHRSEPMT